MFVYFILCLLTAPQVFGDDVVEDDRKYDWFECHDNTNNLSYTNEFNAGFIKIYQLCNGIRDCKDGSDEILSVCKLHPQSMYEAYFYCASGGSINLKLKCNGKSDCWDGSDEKLCNNNQQNNVINDKNGYSSDDKWQCLPGESISKSKLCNHKIDCTNGKDESIENCYRNCTSEQFQCGYGLCINKTQVCDQHIDCLDGADELPVVCSDIFNSTIAPYTECREPQSRDRLRFSDRTKHRLGYKNRTVFKYVLPNEPAHFACPTYLEFRGTPWNVCTLNGTWHHELPKCLHPYA